MKAKEFLEEYRKRQKRNKFNAKSTVYNGRRYDSKLEASYAMELDWQKKAGLIKDWEAQRKLDIRVNGEHICNYYIDFVVIRNDGIEEMHEVKGAELPLWKLKYKLAQVIYPNKFVLIK